MNNLALQLEHERRILRIQKEQHEKLAKDAADRMQQLEEMLTQFLREDRVT